MGKLRIITDTASDITKDKAEELGVTVIPISIKFEEEEMPMESEEDFHRFFRRLAVEKELPTTKGVNLLSIGRFCTAKNFDNVPFICKLIRQQGLDVKWYLIGYGGDEALIRKNIREQGMEDHVIILGKKENPYPYIKACDVYVQPSRYEGKCVAVREAQMLGKPVVITNYATSASQLQDGVDGVIVPMDNGGCAAGIAALLRDKEALKRLSDTCRQRDYSNADEVNKLYALMEG